MRSQRMQTLRQADTVKIRDQTLLRKSRSDQSSSYRPMSQVILKQVGFDYADRECIDVLESIYLSHLKQLGKQASERAQLNQRTSVNLLDLELDTHGLIAFMNNCKGRIRALKPKELLVPKVLQTSTRPNHVSHYLPGFPNKHSYLQTRIPLHDPQESLETRKRQLEERDRLSRIIKTKKTSYYETLQ